jgi:hypothetical protein
MELVEETCFLGGQGELVGLMDARVGDRDHGENRKVPEERPKMLAKP